jgi:hypothetical protein
MSTKKPDEHKSHIIKRIQPDKMGGSGFIVAAGKGASVNVSNGHTCHRDSKNPLEVTQYLSLTQYDNEPVIRVELLDHDLKHLGASLKASRYDNITENEALGSNGKLLKSTSGPNELVKSAHIAIRFGRTQYIPEERTPYKSIPASAGNNPLAVVGIHCLKNGEPSYPVLDDWSVRNVLMVEPAPLTPKATPGNNNHQR